MIRTYHPRYATYHPVIRAHITTVWEGICKQHVAQPEIFFLTILELVYRWPISLRKGCRRAYNVSWNINTERNSTTGTTMALGV